MENAGEEHDRKASGKYCKLTPCVVSEKNWNTKGGKHDTCIVCTAVGERHVSGQSNLEQ